MAAVIDVALNSQGRPVSAKALAIRHALPSRHLEPVLQALVREGILKGIRGPHGGYELARDRKRITADDILRAAGTIEDENDRLTSGSDLPNEVVLPAIGQAERAFAAALSRINIDDLARRAVRRRRFPVGLTRGTHSACLAAVHGLDSFGPENRCG